MENFKGFAFLALSDVSADRHIFSSPST